MRPLFTVFAGIFALTASFTAQAANEMITGAGATFPYPLYSKWFSDYHALHPELQFNYQSIGSGGGIRQLLDKTVDFGASDAPMTDEQLAKSPEKIIHIPTVLGAVVVTFNVPGITGDLQLTSQLVADIFLGKITKWSDPALVKANPKLSLPSSDIIVVHRSDGSGTTAIFSDYLAKISDEWKSKVGSGTALKWPTGLGGKGNEGVAGLLKQTQGSIGYIELIYAETNKLAMAKIQNAAGHFVAATTTSVTAAAQSSAKTIPDDFRVSITNPPGKTAYPISGFTYLLVYPTLEKQKGQKLVDCLKWAVGPGQSKIAPLTYSPLPRELVARVNKKIASIQLK
jgi:phosphate transport system substrate-binding protein